MVFEQYKRSENERDKFVEDSEGNVAIRVTMVV